MSNSPKEKGTGIGGSEEAFLVDDNLKALKRSKPENNYNKIKLFTQDIGLATQFYKDTLFYSFELGGFFAKRGYNTNFTISIKNANGLESPGNHEEAVFKRMINGINSPFFYKDISCFQKDQKSTENITNNTFYKNYTTIPLYPMEAQLSNFFDDDVTKSEYVPSTTDLQLWLIEIASGLNDLHTIGSYHGNINDESVIINNNGDVIIGNFIADNSQESTLTPNSYYFRSPEFLSTGHESMTIESYIKLDIYQFGMLMNEFIEKEKPNKMFSNNEFTKKDKNDIIARKHKFIHYPRQKDRNNLFVNIIDSCLDLDPLKRPKITTVLDYLLNNEMFEDVNIKEVKERYDRAQNKYKPCDQISDFCTLIKYFKYPKVEEWLQKLCYSFYVALAELSQDKNMIPDIKPKNISLYNLNYFLSILLDKYMILKSFVKNNQPYAEAILKMFIKEGEVNEDIEVNEDFLSDFDKVTNIEIEKLLLPFKEKGKQFDSKNAVTNFCKIVDGYKDFLQENHSKYFDNEFAETDHKMKSIPFKFRDIARDLIQRYGEKYSHEQILNIFKGSLYDLKKTIKEISAFSESHSQYKQNSKMKDNFEYYGVKQANYIKQKTEGKKFRCMSRLVTLSDLSPNIVKLFLTKYSNSLNEQYTLQIDFQIDNKRKSNEDKTKYSVFKEAIDFNFGEKINCKTVHSYNEKGPKITLNIRPRIPD